jgi:hypothetical protein
MSLDTSKLNLQGLGVLSSNATMVSGTNPSEKFNLTIKADDDNYNFTSETLTLENITSISGSSTFKITSNPGYQVNASMFVNTNQSSYYSSITFSNTINNLDPLNEVLITVNWIDQSITEDVDLILYNVLSISIPDGNVFHRLNIEILNSEFIDININPSEGMSITGNFIQGNIVAGESKVLCEIVLRIKDDYEGLKAFSQLSNFMYTINSDLSTSNYGIYYTQSLFTRHKFQIFLNAPLNYSNLLSVPDFLQVTPNLDTPTIGADPTTFPELDFNESNQTINLETYLCNVVDYNAVVVDENGNVTSFPAQTASWITFNNYNSGNLNITISNNSTLIDRYAMICIYNTSDTTTIPSETIFVHQGEELILYLEKLENTDGIVTFADGLSLGSIPRDGGQVTYRATINPNVSWPGELLSQIIVADNDSGQPYQWVSNNITGTLVENNVFDFTIDFPPQSFGSPSRSVEVTLNAPHAPLSKTFTLTQRKGFDINTDSPTIYIGTSDDMVNQGTANQYFDLTSYENADYNISLDHLSNNVIVGIELSPNDISDGMSASDFIINLNFLNWPGLGWTYASFTLNVPPAENSEYSYDGYFVIPIPANQFSISRTVQVIISHPDGPDVFGFYISQDELPTASWDISEVTIDTSGNVNVPFYSSNTSTGNTPVIALAGVKQFSYPEGETQPAYNNIAFTDENGSGNDIPHNYVDSVNGFHPDGITSAPTIAINANETNGTATFTIQDNFQFDDPPLHETYRLYIYYIYPNGTSLNGMSPTGDDGLRVYPPDSTTPPSVLTIRQNLINDTAFITVNGAIFSTYPFDIANAFPANISPFVPLIDTSSGTNSTLSFDNVSLSVSSNTLSNAQAEAIDSIGNVSSSFLINLNDVDRTYLNGFSTCNQYLSESRSFIVGLNISSNEAAIEIIEPVDYYRVYFTDGTNVTINNDTHNANYIGVIEKPTLTIHTDGATLGYPTGFETYLKFNIVAPPNEISYDGSNKDVDFIKFYNRFTCDDIIYGAFINLQSSDFVGLAENFAVFLLQGGRNMVGQGTPSGVYVDNIFEYRFNTYNADPTDGTVNSIATPPLDYLNESAGTHGLARQFVKELRDNNYYSGRKILLIPAAGVNATFNSNGSLVTGNSSYNTAVGMCNRIFSTYPLATLEGILFQAGELETSNASYAIDFFNSVQKLRNDITKATQETPFIVGRTLISGANTNAWNYSVINRFDDNFYRSATIDSTGGTSTGDNISFSSSFLDTTGTRYYIQFTSLLQTATDQYPLITSYIKADKHYFFGLDNQMFFDSKSTHQMTLQSAVGSYPGYHTFSASETEATYNTLAEKIKYSTLIFDGKYLRGLNTGLAETVNQTFAIAFRLKQHDAVTGSNNQKLIFGNLPLISDSIKGFGMYINANSDIVMTSLEVASAGGDVVATVATKAQCESIATHYGENINDVFIFVVATFNKNGYRTWWGDPTSSTGVLDFSDGGYVSASNSRAGTLSSLPIMLGNGHYNSTFFENNIEIAYFSYLETGININTGGTFHNRWYHDVRDYLATRNIKC